MGLTLLPATLLAAASFFAISLGAAFLGVPLGIGAVICLVAAGYSAVHGTQEPASAAPTQAKSLASVDEGYEPSSESLCEMAPIAASAAPAPSGSAAISAVSVQSSQGASTSPPAVAAFASSSAPVATARAKAAAGSGHSSSGALAAMPVAFAAGMLGGPELWQQMASQPMANEQPAGIAAQSEAAVVDLGQEASPQTGAVLPMEQLVDDDWRMEPDVDPQWA